MIGRKILPCGHRRTRFPEQLGEYNRTCPTCKHTYVCEVVESVYLTWRLGVTVLTIVWDDVPLTRHKPWDNADAPRNVARAARATRAETLRRGQG